MEVSPCASRCLVMVMLMMMTELVFPPTSLELGLDIPTSQIRKPRLRGALTCPKPTKGVLDWAAGGLCLRLDTTTCAQNQG